MTERNPCGMTEGNDPREPPLRVALSLRTGIRNDPTRIGVDYAVRLTYGGSQSGN